VRVVGRALHADGVHRLVPDPSYSLGHLVGGSGPRGLEAKPSWDAPLGGWEGHLPLRPHQDPRRGLLHRHPAADGVGLAARRPRVLLHPHRHHRPLPADARQGGLLPDGLGRQRPAHRAAGAELLRRPLRPVAAPRPRLHPRPSPTRRRKQPGPRSAGATSSSCASAHRRGREGLRGPVAPARPVGRLVADLHHHRRPQPRTSQRAFLRNLARGEAYQPRRRRCGTSTSDRGRPGRARGPRAPGAYHRSPSTRPGGGRRAHRHHPPRAAPGLRRAGRPPRRRALPAAVRHHRHHAAVRRRGARSSPTRWPSPTRAPASP
jgi:hypothetical protein